MVHFNTESHLTFWLLYKPRAKWYVFLFVSRYYKIMFCIACTSLFCKSRVYQHFLIVTQNVNNSHEPSNNRVVTFDLKSIIHRLYRNYVSKHINLFYIKIYPTNINISMLYISQICTIEQHGVQTTKLRNSVRVMTPMLCTVSQSALWV